MGFMVEFRRKGIQTIVAIDVDSIESISEVVPDDGGPDPAGAPFALVRGKSGEDYALEQDYKGVNETIASAMRQISMAMAGGRPR